MVGLTGAFIGFAVGAGFAAILNIDLASAVFQARRVNSERGLAGDSEAVMRWIRRALLVVLPLAFGLIGLAAALLGGQA
jgi:hypothetical protein